MQTNTTINNYYKNCNDSYSYKSSKNKKGGLSAFGFTALAGIFMAKLTAFKEYEHFGFDFFPKIDGFAGSTHFFSTFIVYFVFLSLIVIAIKIFVQVSKTKPKSNKYDFTKWYFNIFFIRDFIMLYVNFYRSVKSGKVVGSFNGDDFVFFNMYLVLISPFIFL